MPSRKKISKRARFDVFKRDQFTCQYCGKTPPGVVLEIDHIIAVASGGSGEHTNLITACFDCNRGKGAVPLSDRPSPLNLKKRRQLIEERVEQAEAYELLLKERKRTEDESIDEIIRVYETNFDEKLTLPDGMRISIRKFLRQLPRFTVMEAMDLACSRVGYKEREGSTSYVFKYFCGICWNTIKQGSSND